MKIRALVIMSALAGTSVQAHAQWAVIDAANLGQATQQVKAWAEQYRQMRAQIDSMDAQHRSMTGNRGMATLLPGIAPALPSDWAQSMTQLSSLAQQIRQSQAILTPRQAVHMSGQLQQFLSQAQDVSAANQAMAQVAFNDAAARQSRLQTLTAALAATEDPKDAYDLANRIAIEHAALLKDQNQLEAVVGAATAQDRAQRLMISQMRAASAGTEIPRFDTPQP